MALIHNISPKQRFIDNEQNIHAHRELIARADLQQSLDFATLQYAGALASTVRDGNTALAAGFKLAGAYEFQQELRMLAEAPTQVSRAQIKGIDYNADKA